MVLLKMKSELFFAFFCVCCATVVSVEDNEIKRGLYPFMGFLYYPDETVLDSSGARFLRSAVLIRPEWLLSSTIEMRVGFPRKTLLARMGAVAIDANITLNEDEDEQEREIIQVVRPNVDDPGSWWSTDISLLKTLLPFTNTFAVTPVVINPKHDYGEKNCIILVYTKNQHNSTEERSLVQLSVDMLPPNVDNCGNQFSETTMACATTDNENTKKAELSPDFCLGNSGGPLVCDNEVMGLQTYIDNNCKPPHLYQLLYSWENFINCGVSEKCNHDYICNICTATNKDESSLSELLVPVQSVISTAPPSLALTETNITRDTSDTTILTVPTKDDSEGGKVDDKTVIDNNDKNNKDDQTGIDDDVKDVKDDKIEMEDVDKNNKDDKIQIEDKIENKATDGNRKMLVNEISISEANMTKSKNVSYIGESDVNARPLQTTINASSLKTDINASVQQDGFDGKSANNATIESGRKTAANQNFHQKNIKQKTEKNTTIAIPQNANIKQTNINGTVLHIAIDSNVKKNYTNATSNQTAHDSIHPISLENATISAGYDNKSKDFSASNSEENSNISATHSSHVYIKVLKPWSSPYMYQNGTVDAKQPTSVLTERAKNEPINKRIKIPIKTIPKIPKFPIKNKKSASTIQKSLVLILFMISTLLALY